MVAGRSVGDIPDESLLKNVCVASDENIGVANTRVQGSSGGPASVLTCVVEEHARLVLAVLVDADITIALEVIDEGFAEIIPPSGGTDVG